MFVCLGINGLGANTKHITLLWHIVFNNNWDPLSEMITPSGTADRLEHS